MRNQATRLDVLEEQRQRQKQRLEHMILAPAAIIAIAVIGYAFGMFFAA